MVGIYKITSPSERVYIGQSINIEKRFKAYLKLRHCKTQRKLYKSFLKYGVENHKFEIVTLCYEEQLNEFERDFQEAYDVIKTGLNCRLTETADKSGKLSEEMKYNIRLSVTGIACSEETKLKLRSIRGEDHFNYGRKHSLEHRKKISESNSGKNHHFYDKKLSKEHVNKLIISHLGNIPSKETKLKMSESKKGGNNPNAKKVINIETEQVWECVGDCALSMNINKGTLTSYLNNRLKNKTSLIYLENYDK